MKRFILAAAMLMVAAAAQAAPVRVDNGTAGHGSGFTIGDGLVVTAGHAVATAPYNPFANTASLTVVTEDGQKASAVVLWASYQYDVALLKVTQDDYKEPAPSQMNCGADPVIGTDIELVGNPFGESFVHTWGRVGTIVGSNTVTTNIGDIPVSTTWPSSYLIDATIAHGESGGPVTSSDGKVVGVLDGIEQDNSFGFVVPATTVCKLLEGNKATG